MANRFLLALALACPTCAGGIFFAPFLALGVSAVVAKSIVVGLLAATVVVLYIIGRRRYDQACGISPNNPPQRPADGSH